MNGIMVGFILYWVECDGFLLKEYGCYIRVENLKILNKKYFIFKKNV